MTQAERQAQLEHLLLNLLLNLLPADGSSAANGPLQAMWALHAASTGLATSPDDFSHLRESLVARGLVVKRKGRGGATALAAAAASGSESFELESGAATADAAAPGRHSPPATQKPAAKPKPRAADAGGAAGPVPRHRVAALRGRQARQGGGEDRGRPGHRVVENIAAEGLTC